MNFSSDDRELCSKGGEESCQGEIEFEDIDPDNVQPVKQRENYSDDGPDSEEPLAEAIYQVIVLVSWKFKNPGERFDWSIYRVVVGKCVMWLAVRLSLDCEDGFPTGCRNVSH